MQRFVGLRLFNDDTTPMEVVLRILMRELHLAESVAFAAMLRVHTEGHEIVALIPEQEAEVVSVRVAAAIEKHAVALHFEMTAPLDRETEAEWRRDSKEWPDDGNFAPWVGAVVGALVVRVVAGVIAVR